MNFYLDCEYNGFGGKLISMALVGDDGYEWYQVLPHTSVNKWVKDNVLPVLNKTPVSSFNRFRASLEAFLRPYREVHIISDWPEDIAHFCNTLIIGPGKAIPIDKLTFAWADQLNTKSEIPHNALSDARALKEAIKNLK